MSKKYLLILSILFNNVLFAQASADLHAVTSKHGYTINIFSNDTPIRINHMHSWVVQLLDQQGNPVDNAELKIDGGMPQHNHGLPTAPQITKSLGDGKYLLEGIKFHMNGRWQMEAFISVGDQQDNAVFELNL